MAVELDSITQTEFILSSRYLAKLCDYVPYMILNSRSLIALKALFTAYWSLFDILSLVLRHVIRAGQVGIRPKAIRPLGFRLEAA